MWTYRNEHGCRVKVQPRGRARLGEAGTEVKIPMWEKRKVARKKVGQSQMEGGIGARVCSPTQLQPVFVDTDPPLLLLFCVHPAS